MPCLTPCAIFLIVILVLLVISWTATRAWGRGFGLAFEACQLGAFNGLDLGNDTYSEGLSYSSKAPSYSNAVLAATKAKASKGSEGFIFRETMAPVPRHSNYQMSESFSYDFVLPDSDSAALGAASQASPFIGHL